MGWQTRLHEVYSTMDRHIRSTYRTTLASMLCVLLAADFVALTVLALYKKETGDWLSFPMRYSRPTSRHPLDVELMIALDKLSHSVVESVHPVTALEPPGPESVRVRINVFRSTIRLWDVVGRRYYVSVQGESGANIPIASDVLSLPNVRETIQDWLQHGPFRQDERSIVAAKAIMAYRAVVFVPRPVGIAHTLVAICAAIVAAVLFMFRRDC